MGDGYNPKMKAQSSQWKTLTSPQPKKAQQVWRKIKLMRTVFSAYQGVDHNKYAPEGLLLGALCHLLDAVSHKRWELWEVEDWQPQYDTAPAHSSHLIHDFWPKTGSHRSCSLTLLIWFPATCACFINWRCQNSTEKLQFMTVVQNKQVHMKIICQRGLLVPATINEMQYFFFFFLS